MVRTANEQSMAKYPRNMGDHQAVTNSCETQLEDFEVLVGDLRDSLGEYLRKRPLVSSGLVFLAGFYVGWKIKPW